MNTLLEPTRPAQVIPKGGVPKLYAYDHCPFCARVRFILGAKNIKHHVVFLANDDKETPTKLVGKKVVPILDIEGEIIKESMDIVKRIDNDAAFGPPILAPASGRTDIADWFKQQQDVLAELVWPRNVASGVLPEFYHQAGRDAYITNHPLPPATKEAWQDPAVTDRVARNARFNQALERTSELLPRANAALKDLDRLIHSAESASPGGLSYDDVDLFGRLRVITIVRGLALPEKTGAYLRGLAGRADVPLFTPIAL